MAHPGGNSLAASRVLLSRSAVDAGVARSYTERKGRWGLGCVAAALKLWGIFYYIIFPVKFFLIFQLMFIMFRDGFRRIEVLKLFHLEAHL